MAKSYLIFALLINLGVQKTLAQREYCNISPSHTLCQYQDFGRNCGRTGPIFRGLTEGEKSMVVDMHNKFRSRVAQGREGRGSPGPQKPASNMLELTWDNELELIGQRWADQCDFGHDTVRGVSRFSVGQNVYEASDFNEGPIDLKRAVNGWYSEVDNVSNKLVDKFQFMSGTGHYTQMVWASTYKIGCGYAAYRKRNFVKKFIVCNYGDAGNLLNAPMYQVGRPCSKCPANICSRRFPGLCPVPGETGFSPSNSTMVDINNDVENIRPSTPAGSNGAFEPMFVDNNDVEEFNPPRPQVTRPVQQNLRPVRPVVISSNPNPLLFNPRPNFRPRPISMFDRLIAGLFRG